MAQWPVDYPAQFESTSSTPGLSLKPQSNYGLFSHLEGFYSFFVFWFAGRSIGRCWLVRSGLPYSRGFYFYYNTSIYIPVLNVYGCRVDRTEHIYNSGDAENGGQLVQRVPCINILFQQATNTQCRQR